MLAFIQRNLLLYFNNRKLIFLSLIGALISFALYLLFLKNNIQSEWQRIPHATKILDPWLMGGTLATTAITTSFSGVSQRTVDQENNTLTDIMMTDVKSWQLEAGYLGTAVIISTVMQMVVWVVMQIYFQLTDHVTSQWGLFPEMVEIAIINSIVWSAFHLIIIHFINQQQTLSMVSAIDGTIAGFLTGVYVPISIMPTMAQTIIKFTPAPYSAALYRQVLTNHQTKLSFQNLPSSVLHHFQKEMGIRIQTTQLLNLSNTLITLIGFIILFIIIILILNWHPQRSRV